MSENWDRLLREGENQIVEFKEDIPSDAKELADEIAAFATAGGGTIYLGINDDKQVVGLSNAAHTQKRVGGISNQHVKPHVQIRHEILRYRDVDILKVCVIPSGSDPIYYANGRPRIRKNDEASIASPSEVIDLVLRSDLVKRLKEVGSRLGSQEIVAAGIKGQGQLATMNLVDVDRYLETRNSRKLT